MTVPFECPRTTGPKVIKICNSSDARAVNKLLDRRPGRDPRIKRRVAAIVARVRRDGDRALIRFARELDGLSGPLEVTREELAARRPAGRAGDPGRHGRRGEKHPPRGCATNAVGLENRNRSRCVHRAARAAARPGGLLRPRGPVSPVLVVADDRDSRAGLPASRKSSSSVRSQIPQSWLRRSKPA